MRADSIHFAHSLLSKFSATRTRVASSFNDSISSGGAPLSRSGFIMAARSSSLMAGGGDASG